jgi:hypothetical protein
MRMYISLIIIGFCIISSLILRYKFKIPKSKNINVRTSQPKYLMYILIISGVFTLLVTIFIKNAKYLLLWIVIYSVIDCGYKIKHLRNNKSRYYVIIELIFWLYCSILVTTSLIW